jgi:hypothetical protein
MMDVSLYDARRSVLGKWYYDRPTDWDKARMININVAAVKISEGGRVYRNGRYVDGSFEDPAFRVQWAAAAGRPRLAYHFFRSNRNAIMQAQDVLEIWASVEHNQNDRLCLDFETTDGMTGNACLLAFDSWMYQIMQEVDHTPMLYTYPAFWLQIGGGSASWAAKYPLLIAQWPLDNWIANLKVPPYSFSGERLTELLAKIQDGRMVPLDGKPYNRSLAPWGSDFTAWQFTARAYAKDIPGHPAIKRVVDLNVIYKPWWTEAETPLVVEEKPKVCLTCGQPLPCYLNQKAT